MKYMEQQQDVIPSWVAKGLMEEACENSLSFIKKMNYSHAGKAQCLSCLKTVSNYRS